MILFNFKLSKNNGKLQKILSDFFSSILSLVDRATRYLLLMGTGSYLMELIKVCSSWFGHHNYQK